MAGSCSEHVLGDNRVDVRAVGHIRASADGSPVEGDALDHGINPLPGGELQGRDRLAGKPRDQRVPATIEAKLRDRPIGRPNLGNDTGQDVQSA